MRGTNPPGESAREFRLSGESVRAVSEQIGPPPGSRRFTSTDHISPEAVAAFVDDALPVTARQRAQLHLDRCPQCRDEVRQQEDVRRALRGSGPIRMPDQLRSKLSDIGDVPRRPEPLSRWQQLLRRICGEDR